MRDTWLILISLERWLRFQIKQNKEAVTTVMCVVLFVCL